MLVIVRALDPAGVQSLRLAMFRFSRRTHAAKGSATAVGIVSIDDRSLAHTANGRGHGRAWRNWVDKIAAGKPSVLGIDIIFAEPDRLSPGRLSESDPEIPAQIVDELSKLPTHESILADAIRKVPTVLAVGGNDEVGRRIGGPARVTNGSSSQAPIRDRSF